MIADLCDIHKLLLFSALHVLTSQAFDLTCTKVFRVRVFFHSWPFLSPIDTAPSKSEVRADVFVRR